MAAPVLPLALGTDLSAGLLALLRVAVENDPPGALKAALDDRAVHTLVLMLSPGEPPVAMLAACLSASDALAQWRDLSCI